MQDEATHEITIVDDLYIASARAVYEAYADLINYFADLESGMVAAWTETEYNRTPEIIVQMRRIFRSRLDEQKAKHERRHT